MASSAQPTVGRAARPLASLVAIMPAVMLAIMLAVMLVGGAIGCGSPRPEAAHRALVRDAILPTTLRLDADDANARTDAAETIRRTQPVLRAALGEPTTRRTIVWQLSPEGLERFLGRIGQDANTGAATLVARGTPEIFLQRPMPTATAEGDAAQRLRAEFVLAHEYTHAWLGAHVPLTSRSDLEEGLANWVGLASLEDRSIGGVRFDGPRRLAIAMTRLTARTDAPITVAALLRARGEDAYVFGTSLFLWLADEARDMAAFSAVTRRAISPLGVHANDLSRHLQTIAVSDAPEPPVEDRFRNWLDRTDAAARTWWAPLGYVAIGTHDDGRVLLADSESIIAMSFGDPAALPADARALDLEKGLPPFDRVTEVTVRVRGGDAVVDPAFRHESIRTGLAIVSGQSRGVPSAAIRLREGEAVELRVEGVDVVAAIDGRPIARWEGAACQLFAVASIGQLPDGRLPVVEVSRGLPGGTGNMAPAVAENPKSKLASP